MANFKVYPLNCGTIIRAEEMPVVAFYLTDGKNHVIIDTAGTPANGVDKMPYFQEEDQNIEAQLKKLGVDPLSINIVINTHLHWDHMSNNHLFPNAKHYVQKSEYLYACAPVPTQKWGFDLERIIKTDWIFCEGDEEIIEGLSVLLVGGHTPGSQVVIADTEKGRAAITSDFLTKYEQWESEPKQATNVYTDIIQYYQGLKKLEKACDFIIPGHNYQVLEHKVLP